MSRRMRIENPIPNEGAIVIVRIPSPNHYRLRYVMSFGVLLRFRASRFPSRTSGRSAAPTPSRSSLPRPWQLVPSARSDRDRIELILTSDLAEFFRRPNIFPVDQCNNERDP